MIEMLIKVCFTWRNVHCTKYFLIRITISHQTFLQHSGSKLVLLLLLLLLLLLYIIIYYIIIITITIITIIIM